MYALMNACIHRNVTSHTYFTCIINAYTHGSTHACRHKFTRTSTSTVKKKTYNLLPAKPCRFLVDLLSDDVRLNPNDTDNSADGDSDITLLLSSQSVLEKGPRWVK